MAHQVKTIVNDPSAAGVLSRDNVDDPSIFPDMRLEDVYRLIRKGQL